MNRQAYNSDSPAAEAPGEPRARQAVGSALLRPVQPEDAEGIHALLVAGLPDVPADGERWRARWSWQYWSNPYRGDRPAGWVLADGDRITGHLGAVYIPLRVGDERVTGVVGADYVVADDALARGGVFAGLQLAEAFFSTAKDCVAMATTANEKTGAVFSRFGCQPVLWTRQFWRAPASLTQQIRACRSATSRVVRRLLCSRAGFVVSGALGRCYRYLHYGPAVPIPVGCRLETTVPQLAGDLGWIWEGFAWGSTEMNPGDHDRTGKESAGVQRTQSPGAGVVGIDRTQAYLGWRYGRHPERENIRVLVLRDRDGHPIGAAVVFLDERKTRRTAFVEELITLPDRIEAVHTLLCAALKLACDHDADYLVTTPGRRAIRHVFRELGFEPRARSAPAVVMQPPLSMTATREDTPAAPFPDDDLDFWHGEMF